MSSEQESNKIALKLQSAEVQIAINHLINLPTVALKMAINLRNNPEWIKGIEGGE